MRLCVSSIRFISFISSFCSRAIRLSRICRSASALARACFASIICDDSIMCCDSESMAIGVRSPSLGLAMACSPAKALALTGVSTA